MIELILTVKSRIKTTFKVQLLQHVM